MIQSTWQVSRNGVLTVPKATEVEVKVDENYVYSYCDSCVEKLPDFIVDTKRVVDVNDPDLKCDGCGKVMVDSNAET